MSIGSLIDYAESVLRAIQRRPVDTSVLMCDRLNELERRAVADAAQAGILPVTDSLIRDLAVATSHAAGCAELEKHAHDWGDSPAEAMLRTARAFTPVWTAIAKLQRYAEVQPAAAASSVGPEWSIPTSKTALANRVFGAGGGVRKLETVLGKYGLERCGRQQWRVRLDLMSADGARDMRSRIEKLDPPRQKNTRQLTPTRDNSRRLAQ